MSDAEKAKTDQVLAQIRDGLPSFWWAIYTGCLQQGFCEKQSMQILIAYIQKSS